MVNTFILKRSITILVFLLLGLAVSGGMAAIINNRTAPGDLPVLPEVQVIQIPLAGPAKNFRAEISGMAWYGDQLILLPQYPNRFGTDRQGNLFSLKKQDILDYIDRKSFQPLIPDLVPLETPGDLTGKSLRSQLKGYEGFESIAFYGNEVYLTIETSPDGMLGFLISGDVQPQSFAIHLEPTSLEEIQPQAKLKNYSEEALIIYDKSLYTFYEANGARVNPSPRAHRFDISLNPAGEVPFPTIEYRITDATPPDEQGWFWAINSFFPPDYWTLLPGPDGLVRAYGEGQSHRENWAVERLVKLQVTTEGIQLADQPPIYLNLWESYTPRNWEAIAPLDDRGFILATDKFPGTILGFVPLDEK